MFLVFVYIAINLFTAGDAKVSLFAPAIIIAPDDGFVQYFIFDDGEIAHDCIMQHNRIPLKIPLVDDMEPLSPVFKERLTNLGRHICGFKISSINQDDGLEFIFMLYYEDALGQLKSAMFDFTVNLNYDVVEPKNIILPVRLGETRDIVCADYRESCIIYNHYGDKISTECIHTIPQITLVDIGVWKCLMSFLNSMQEVEQYIDVQNVERNSMDMWYKEEDGYGIIGCKYNKDITTVPTYCQIVRPDMKTLTIFAGSAIERYSSTGTNLNELLCQIEFKLPIIDSEEIGTWQCKIDDSGYFLQVKTTSIPAYEKNFKQFVRMNEKLEIKCSVPYSTENCYIKSPTGLIYNGGFQQDFWLGKCATTIDIANSAHIGVWACHYSTPNHSLDDVITIEVQSTNNVASVLSRIEEAVSTSVQLKCKSTSPIRNCRFVDPTGKSYQLSPTKATSEFSYVGQGFEYGDCGMSIGSLQTIHDGIWKCFVHSDILASDAVEFEVQAEINVVVVVDDVNKSGTIQAATIGIALGLTAIVIIALLVILFIRYRKK